MYEQLDLFSLLEPKEPPKQICKRLNVGDCVGRVVLGEVEKAIINKVEGNDKYFFYRTNKGCFSSDARTDFEQMEIEAQENLKRYTTLEIDKFDKFFAVAYPPRECDGRTLYAMAGIYKGMLFWKEEVTYQFLEPVKNIEKAYEDKVFEITHEWYGEKNERQYVKLDKPVPVKRLYLSKHGFYSEARYVETNG